MPSPQSITEAATWDTPLTALGGGENVDPTNMLRDMQKVANRLKYLGDRIGIAGSPAPLVKQYADIAALKAVNPGSAGFVDGDYVWVGGTQHLGAYRYNSGASTTEDRPWVIAPTAGSGRWFHSAYDLRPRNVGLTDATNRDVSSGSYADFSSLSTTIAGGITGDILEVECFARFSDSAAGASQIRVVAVDGGSTTVVFGSGAESLEADTNVQAFVGIARTVLAADGTVTVKMQGKTTGAGAARITACCIRARLVKDQA